MAYCIQRKSCSYPNSPKTLVLLTVGATEGFSEGDKLGVLDGSSECVKLGSSDGILVGIMEGNRLGTPDGTDVGI